MQQIATRIDEDISKVESTIEDDYLALTMGVALVDRSGVGRLSVSGEDALDLLNRLSTNELMTLEVGEGAPTILTSNKGRIVDLLHVFRLHDRLFVMTSPGNQQKVAEWIDFYTFVEDVVVEDSTNSTKMLSIVGPDSATFLDELTNGQASKLQLHERFGSEVGGIPAEVYRTDFLGGPSFDIVVEVEQGERLFGILTNSGAVAVGTDAVEAVRIENSVPAFGKELTEVYNPHEANLVDHVSFSKGCYIGQEVVARLQTYQKVQRYLVSLRWQNAELAPGGKLMLDSKQIGVVTSSSPLSTIDEGIGLGYVRKELAEDGTVVTSEDGTDVVVIT
jgi:folate-binding protein YgfZ